jgi:hypothetical protein
VFILCSLVVLVQLCTFCVENSFAYDPWADTAYFLYEGNGSGFGKGPFPGNVTGPPDSNATPCIPSADPKEIRSLGTNGVIVIGFLDNRVIDEAGPDFVIFENSFIILCCDTCPDNIYAETGIVSVSQDSINFVEYPYNPITWEGLAGVTPTSGEDPLDPGISGGDAFDIGVLGFSWISYVKIQDAGTLVSDKGPHFDLDAVVAVHSGLPVGIEEKNPSYPLHPPILLEQNFPNPFSQETIIRYSIPNKGMLSIYNLSGQRVFSTFLSPESQIFHYRSEALPIGFYIYEIEGNNWRMTRKMLRVR